MTLAVSHPSPLLDEATLCAEVVDMPVERVRALADFARQRDESLVRVLIDRGGVDEANLLSGLASRLDHSFLENQPDRIDPEVIALVPPQLAVRYHAVPLEVLDGVVSLTWADPFDWEAWDDLAQLLGMHTRMVLCPHAIIDRLLKLNYGLGADTVDHLVAGQTDGHAMADVGATDGALAEEDAANEPTVVNLVNRILSDAISAGATDVHFEPFETKYRVRYRIDGMLEDVPMPASVKLLKLAVISRIKIMADLDITEKRLPQDGRAGFSVGLNEYDLRVSILPGVYGEAVNIRIQNRQMVKLDLEALGYEEFECQRIANLAERPHGLVLVTGPTGSGKTTTLYSCLARINRPPTKILTIEDPVEYWMEDIVQLQVHEEIGFDFARALRSMLRHDPDVMLVGEIRDRETADIAIRASLTGHLVFATLHTNDAAGAVARLLDIGLEPFLVASSANGIVAQRLVRRICPRCKRESAQDIRSGGLTAWEGAGCEHCRFTGYRGRSAVAEVLMVDATIRELIQQRASADAIKRQAIDEGMRTLRETTLSAVRQGITTQAEMLRVTMEDV